MEKQELRSMLFEFGHAIAINYLPLTFFVGGDVEFDRIDIMNNTEPGKQLKSILIDEAHSSLGVPKEQIDELLLTYFLMVNTSVLVEQVGSSISTGVYQPSIDRAVFTLDEDEVNDMFKVYNLKVPEKALRDLNKCINSLSDNFNNNKIKGLKLDWGNAKTSNPRKMPNYDDGVHIIPTDVLVGYYTGLRELASKNALTINYKRVNSTDRKHFTTLNRDIINNVYSEDLQFANTFVEVSTPRAITYHQRHVPADVLSGFWSIGDLGLSRFVINPKRKISLSRITSIKHTSDTDFKEIRKFVNVDLDSVVDIFLHYALQLNDADRDRIMRDLDCDNPDLMHFIQARQAIFTSSYSKFLHDYMLENQDLFKGYTGVKTKAYENTFNMQNTQLNFGSTHKINF